MLIVWLDVLIQGALLGGLYALFALGLSLMFGVMRLTNVAHGDLVVLAGFAAIAATAGGGGSPLRLIAVALLLLPVAFGVGYGLQRGVLNGTVGRDPLPSMVVTFGISIVVQNALLQAFSADPRALDAGALATASLPLPGGMALGMLPLLIFGIALAATVGLQALFARTPLGRSFRAVSDDREIAELMGLDAGKVQALATGIAFVLVAIAGVLQAMRTTVSPGDGPLLLLFAFEAVIIGGLGSFWGTFLGALLLGITQQVGSQFDPGWGIWFGHLVFLAVLVVRPQGLFPKTRDEHLEHHQVDRHRRRRRRRRPAARRQPCRTCYPPQPGGCGVLGPADRRRHQPAGLGASSSMRDVVELACYFVFAMMWNLLAGYGGMVSIGQQAYFGLGGYGLLVLADFCGVNPFVAIPLAALATAVVAWPLSWLAFRLQGGYFAIGTWVIAEVVRLSIANVGAVGGGSGTSLTALAGISKATRESVTYWTALACVVVTVLLVYLFLRSKQGLALMAIRDNPGAAASQGIAVGRMKLAVYLVAALGAGLAGALYFVSVLRISPDAAFSVNWSAFAIFMVVIGGIGRIEGPIVGTLVFFVLNKAFSGYGTWYLMGLGLLAIVVTIFFKQGLWGWVQQRWGWVLFPTQRRLLP